ncbi:unnamed protein product, partial [Ectocarpus sp. 12 AP-2014]
RQSCWRAIAIRRRPCATGACARTSSARSLAATDVVAPGVGRHRHSYEQGGGLRPGLRGGTPQTGPIEDTARPQPSVETRPQPSSRVVNALALFFASRKQQEL